MGGHQDARQRFGQLPRRVRHEQPDGVHNGRDHRQQDQQPDRTRHLAHLQAGQGQGPVGHKLALRNEQDAGGLHHQDQRHGQQDIYGAVRQSVLSKNQRGLEIH